jgi:Fic family protein
MDIKSKLEFEAKTAIAVIKNIGRIEKFKGKWEALNFKEAAVLNELRYIATIQSIGSSTRIEGSKLSDREVTELIQNMSINQLETRDEQEVIGYWETLELLLENAPDIDLSERYIYQLHSLLLKYSQKDSSQLGRYKNLANKVVANYPDGTVKTVFQTTEPHLVEKEMKALIEWTVSELEKDEFNPLIVIAAFVYEFLSIHPFHDGNGRLSRLLTTLLLVREGYEFVQYVSFEHVIEERKKEYYTALMECQKYRNTSDEKIGKWVVFFLDCIIQLADKLDAKISRIATNDVYVNDRQREIISILEREGGRSVSEIQETISKGTLPTIKKDLQYLMANELVTRKGIGRGTRYFPRSIQKKN